MVEAFLGLGGNVGNARKTIDEAIMLLCGKSGIRLLARSFAYRTVPWGVEDQPAFINVCIAVETSLTPHRVLAHAQSVENALGRDRGKERRWGPRPIDVDLLAYDDLKLQTPELTLPHPRLFERAFMLVPLAEIAPERMIGGVRVRDALARVDRSGVERLE
ncbi:MAG TPA: 2-amino-4-hydroxy-6-hydroxymethyldihydropteridine diphosphokinase [Candidatus Cybelea sp.]|nr:2-amino-4-hydroxy-6-hydroxymethyldihydropteridine diphosphokinase [Candidatus Cybelea sp.]